MTNHKEPMGFEEIVEAIKDKIRTTTIEKKHPPLEEKYKQWRVGITNDPERRKREHEQKGRKTNVWESWTAETEDIAVKVEKHFLGLGTKGKEGEDEETTQDKVYAF